MSSLSLFSVCRCAFSSAQSISRSAQTLRSRPFSYTASQSQRPTITAQVPEVANLAEVDLSREVAWVTKRDIYSYPILTPYTGRTVAVTKNLGDSLKILDGILARNKVRLQLRLTERHEKKGYKRRRLASERWRNQFANEVRKKVQLVMKMRDRGA